MIKGIIFDMDGVLVDSEKQSNLGWLKAAAEAGVQMPMALIDCFKGAPASLSCQFFDNYYKGQLDYYKLREKRTEHVLKIRDIEGIGIKKGLKELLDFIKASGLKCAVATSTRRESAFKTLHVIRAWDYLDAVVFGDEVDHGKPEPDIFLKAAEMIGIEPDSCIVVEDSINGIKAGHAAGMHVVHIPDTIAVNDQIRALCDFVGQDLTDLIGIVAYYNETDGDGQNIDKASQNIDKAGQNIDKAGFIDLFELEGKTYIRRDLTMSQLYVDRVRVRDFFKTYTDKYDSKDPKIKLKIDHTYRVAALCERLATLSGVCAYDREIAWLLGMLHDVGRFEQVRRFGTFADEESVDHAELAADLLFKDGLIYDFIGDCAKCFSRAEKPKILNELEIVELAIRQHNKFNLPDGLNERELAFCNLLRDADKLDIFKVVCDTPIEDIYKTSQEEYEKSTISPEVLEDFFKHNTVLRSLKKTAIDHLVGHISLVFGLAYAGSRQILKEQGYLGQMLEFESQNPETRESLKKIKHDVEAYLME